MKEYVKVDDYVKYTDIYSKIAYDKCVSTESQDFFFYSKVNIWKENKSTRLFLNNIFSVIPIYSLLKIFSKLQFFQGTEKSCWHADFDTLCSLCFQASH